MRRHSRGFLTLVYFHDNYRTSSTNIFFFCKHILRPISPVYLTFAPRLTTRYILYTKDELLRIIIIHGGRRLGYTIRHETGFSPPEDCRRSLDAWNDRFFIATDSSYLRFAPWKRESFSKREFEVTPPLVHDRYWTAIISERVISRKYA